MKWTNKIILEKDQNSIWHPCSQMKDYQNFKPLIIKKAYGNYLELDNGQRLIDANASWWCKLVGHNHPALKSALLKQSQAFEHVIFANTTHENIVALSHQLTHLTKQLKKVFYAGDGSSAVEVAIKMSLHAHLHQGESKRTHFVALKNGYHGETIGALSVSDMGLYRKPYQALTFKTHFIKPLYVNDQKDPLWSDASQYWQIIEKKLNTFAHQVSAIIIEPILQGAGGMKIYSADFLRRLCLWSKENKIHLIADEIMTGLGRTGKMLASFHAHIEPDILCLSKGLTGGFMPFSAVLTTNEIYQLFYDDYEQGKSFLHSHTYSGHALAASIALQVLKIIKKQKLIERANRMGKLMHEAFLDLAYTTKKLKNIRQIGAVVAADLMTKDQKRRLGYEVFQKAVAYGALLRPLGNTLYWLLPLNTPYKTIHTLKKITEKAIQSVQF